MDAWKKRLDLVCGFLIFLTSKHYVASDFLYFRRESRTSSFP